ncbi:MAG: carbon-nitrogen hydrolase family protein [Planctomycetota bacterium]|nr:carbon-nitrogen hydrolase family protein [Planctomycetota bacterium]
MEKRTEELLAIFDRMAAESHKRYGRGLDLAVLPEMAVTGGRGGWEATARERALPFDGALREAFSKKARELRSYLVVPMNLVEADDPETVSNAAILLDREGRVAGIYRKIHLASQQGKEDLEGGTSPGCEAPVFECDFGKLGIQICLDAMFEYGWDELARRGAELVVWPTWRPGTAHATSRALYHRYFIVSATYMTTAHVFEPTGKIVATADPADPLLVQEIDLSNAIVATGGGRVGEGGADMKERFGGRIGFRFYPEEAYGLFWSNDPKTPVAEMLREIGATELEVLLERQRGIYCKAGVVGAEARVEAAHVAGR